ncbi:MAG: RDD family protein [Candidatus Acidiferrales bacterium]
MDQQAPAQTMAACSQCGRPFAQSDLVQIAGNWVCGDCKPAFLSRVVAGGTSAASPHGWHYGGVWVRLGARTIDGLVWGIPILILAALLIPNMIRTRGGAQNPMFVGTFVVFFVFIVLAVFAYEVVMLRYWGATVGKMACGIKVVRSDGRGLGWGVSIGRYFMWNLVTSGIPYINIVLLPTSTIMAGVDVEKRALHDRVCDTRVIYKRSLA